MIEQEWLTSEDPAKMLRMVDGSVVNGVKVSDRKLRLFACAVARINGHDAESISHVEECVEANQPNHNFSDKGAVDRGQFWRLCTSLRAAQGAVHAYSGAVTAALLREVAGNSFRQYVVVDSDWVAEHERLRPGVFEPRKQTLLRRWLTPTVLTLAQEAYDERPGRACGGCKAGKVLIRAQYDPVGADVPPDWYWEDCPGCGGAGSIDDGTLDPFRLAVLADALEEAGCTDEAILKHLRGFEERSHLPSLYGERYWRPLRGPHVRGCFVLDLILGKE